MKKQDGEIETVASPVARKTSASRQSAPREASASRPATRSDKVRGWKSSRPRTLVDHAVDAILAAAAQGLILPGDRLSEPELVANLGMSRVPIREALRVLESQGVVTSVPYKGIRLMEVSEARLMQIIDVRILLETLASRRAMEAGRNGSEQIAELSAAVDELELMRQRNDVFGFAQADAQFHRLLCSFASNPVLEQLWEALARQLTVIIGLSTQGKPMAEIVEEHRKLLRAFASGDINQMALEIEDHVRFQPLDVNYKRIIDDRRASKKR